MEMKEEVENRQLSSIIMFSNTIAHISRPTPQERRAHAQMSVIRGWHSFRDWQYVSDWLLVCH